MSQESGYGLGEASAEGLTRLNSGYWPGYDLFKGSRGEEVPGLFQLC